MSFQMEVFYLTETHNVYKSSDSSLIQADLLTLLGIQGFTDVLFW